jgi:hypothetical protein
MADKQQRKGGKSQAVAQRPRAQDMDSWLANLAGVEVHETSDGMKGLSFPKGILEHVNLLAPLSQVIQVDRNWKPEFRVTELSGDDVYDVKGGKKAISKVGLMKLVNLAQIQPIGSPEWNYLDGQGIRCSVTVGMKGPDGRDRTANGTITVWFEVLKNQVAERLRKAATKGHRSQPTDQEIDAAYWAEREFLDEKIESKSMLRAVRNLLSVKPAYTAAELQKPFFTISYLFTPDWHSPGVQELVRINYQRAEGQLYGGDLPPPEPAGPAEPAPELHPAPEPASEPAEPEPEPEPEPEDDPGPEDDGGAWDFDGEEEPVEGEVERPPKPEQGFKPRGGPYRGKDVEEIVQSAEGQEWLANQIPRHPEDRRPVALAWLSWGMGREVTEEELPELFA